MSNEKPLKLNMSFNQALQMIAQGGKPPATIRPKPKPKPTAKKAAKPKTR